MIKVEDIHAKTHTHTHTHTKDIHANTHTYTHIHTHTHTQRKPTKVDVGLHKVRAQADSLTVAANGFFELAGPGIAEGGKGRSKKECGEGK